LNPGDGVLAFNIGHFSHLYAECARRVGATVEEIDLPWGRGIPPDLVHERLARDTGRTIKAVLVVHNETATGVTSRLRAIREAIDAAGHPALLIVDVVSALGSIDFRFDEWKIDVALTGSQKGLMLPPGMAILCVGPRALAQSTRVTTPRYFLDWRPVLEEHRRGYTSYTPATLLLYGLREALRMLQEEGLPDVFGRHQRLADGVRTAVRAWGLSTVCEDPAEYSNSLTAVNVPEGLDADAVVGAAWQRLNLSLGVGLGRLKGRAFRIGHLGSLNDLEVIATMAGVEMALAMTGVRLSIGSGVAACQNFLMGHHLARQDSAAR
jgi:alanine-glyoxylate transaminase/serine-glyoxylate transaminase/serine-pyruvate transaminase